MADVESEALTMANKGDEDMAESETCVAGNIVGTEICSARDASKRKRNLKKRERKKKNSKNKKSKSLDDPSALINEKHLQPGDVTLDMRGKYMTMLLKAHGKGAVSALMRSVRAVKKKGGAVYLPTGTLLNREVPLDKNRGTVALPSIPFRRPCILPINGSTMKPFLERYEKHIEGLLYMMPILPVAVYSPKLLFLLMGNSFYATMSSWDLLRYYMCTKFLLLSTKDVIDQDEKIRIEQELKEDQDEAFSDFDQGFLSLPRRDADSLRKLDMLMLKLTYDYINAYEKFILNFLAERDCSMCKGLETPKKRCGECGGSGRDGIPRKHWGDLASKRLVPSIDHISDSLWATLIEDQKALCENRNETLKLVNTSEYPEATINSKEHVQLRHLDFAWNMASMDADGETVTNMIKDSCISALSISKNSDTASEKQGGDEGDNDMPELEDVDPDIEIAESVVKEADDIISAIHKEKKPAKEKIQFHDLAEQQPNKEQLHPVW